MESNYDLGQTTLNYDTTFFEKFSSIWSPIDEAIFSKISNALMIFELPRGNTNHSRPSVIMDRIRFELVLIHNPGFQQKFQERRKFLD